MNHKDLVDNLLTKFNGVQLGKATLFNCDCMELMAHIPDKAIALAIVDPPFGINVNKMNMGGRKTVTPTDKKWDENIPNKDYFDKLIICSKRTVIWGGNYFPLPQSQYFAIWDKGETMYGRDFAEMEYAWVSDGGTRILKLSPNQLDRFHPTQKPVKLYEWLLTNYAKQGDNILDTHGGSMSSVIACNNLGFDIIGCELDKDYFNAGIERVRKAMMQESLFTPAPVVKIEQDKLFE